MAENRSLEQSNILIKTYYDWAITSVEPELKFPSSSRAELEHFNVRTETELDYFCNI